MQYFCKIYFKAPYARAQSQAQNLAHKEAQSLAQGTIPSLRYHSTITAHHHSNTLKPRYTRQRTPLQSHSKKPITKAPNSTKSLPSRLSLLHFCTAIISPDFLTDAQFFHQNPQINKLKKQNTNSFLPARSRVGGCEIVWVLWCGGGHSGVMK